MRTAPSTDLLYKNLIEEYDRQAGALARRLGWLSFVRLLLFAGAILGFWRSFATGSPLMIVASIVAFIAFLLLIRVYDRWKGEIRFLRAVVALNQREEAFTRTGTSDYPAGKEYTNAHHPYSYDLDLFGEGGLFPFLNRCSTPFGKEALADDLLNPDHSQIIQRQEAVAELRDQLTFRQHLQARGSLLDSKEKELRQLQSWLSAAPTLKDRRVYYILSLVPLIGLGHLVAYLVTENSVLLDRFFGFFTVNLLIAISFTRKISTHLSVSGPVNNILQQYAGQLRQIEGMNFRSPLLRDLQQQLKEGEDGKPVTAGASIARLASLFNYLETVVNLVVSIFLNGLFLFHLHVLYALEQWKKQHGPKVMHWLRVLGKTESLNSLANLAFNNPDFCVPQLTHQQRALSVKEMGHPLILASRRIHNSLSFEQERFVILTGSNMSGKSTFLRTLGINLVLARAGSVVCSEEFLFYPFNVHVSMRITDSLQDSESFFYAELRRLHGIIRELEAGDKTFVILDEILRGTNSNDKKNGTVGLIRKLVRANACGIIATHDLTVAELKEEYPGHIGNQCFESEIIDDELLFDYRLKPGVCTRLSASFLMKKMGVID